MKLKIFLSDAPFLFKKSRFITTQARIHFTPRRDNTFLIYAVTNGTNCIYIALYTRFSTSSSNIGRLIKELDINLVNCNPQFRHIPAGDIYVYTNTIRTVFRS